MPCTEPICQRVRIAPEICLERDPFVHVILLALFTEPMYLPTTPASLLWVIPICLSVSLVYKAIKIEEFRPGLFIREVALLFGTIIVFLLVIAFILLVIAQSVR